MGQNDDLINAQTTYASNGKMAAPPTDKKFATTEEGEEEEEEEDEPRLKYASLTRHLKPVYRNGDSTSAFIVGGDKMVCGATVKLKRRDMFKQMLRGAGHRHSQWKHSKLDPIAVLDRSLTLTKACIIAAVAEVYQSLSCPLRLRLCSLHFAVSTAASHSKGRRTESPCVATAVITSSVHFRF